MKKYLILTVIALSCLLSCGIRTGKSIGKEDLTFPFGNQLPSPPFTGEAYLLPMIQPDTVFNFPATNNITFAPGAHSTWHRHGGMIVMVTGGVDGDKFKVGEQAWYTHFRIGRVAPERYEGSQFPEGADAQTQFFCQMTPNTGNYDEALFGKALSAVLADVKSLTGKKSIYLTHSQGGRVGWATDTENIAAIIAVEPGFGPMVGSPEYQKFLDAKVPMLFLFGDYIMNGPADIQSTGFWQMVLNQCRDFAQHYNADGGNAKVVYLPDEGITGNSHFLFQEKNNDVIADYIEKWLKTIKL